jgi:hypothetical protein
MLGLLLVFLFVPVERGISSLFVAEAPAKAELEYMDKPGVPPHI